MSESDSDQSGLYAKFDVRKDGDPVQECSVLEPEIDPAARVALAAYAGHTDDEDLRRDLNEWLGAIWRDEAPEDGGDRDA